ncbi:DBH-LIKE MONOOXYGENASE [Salix purpurea]|uniref:DBH-LIKE MONOOXYGENASE n=1 Tax=Salix purpurea TaxID=77065 RepID=A0A9Q0UL27_SALPP|nr:DBH-LIKE MONOOXYGENASE [Salix purpurea]
MQESSAATSDNEERAIVLFKPVSNLHLLHRSPNNFSVSLDSNIISGFKNQFLWLSQSGGARSVEEEEEEEEAGARRDDSMAVVPWVPSQAQPAFVQEIMYNNASVPQTELMDSDEMGEAAMDIEEDNNDLNHNASVGLGQAQGNQAFGFGGIRAGSDGLPQWQQQHCLVPQIPQNPNPTPITWIP